MTVFERMGRRITKINITFSAENGVRNAVFKFFPLKNSYRLNGSQKTGFWGHIFPHISVSIGPTVSRNNRGHLWIDTHQLCEFHENRFKNATYIMYSYT